MFSGAPMRSVVAAVTRAVVGLAATAAHATQSTFDVLTTADNDAVIVGNGCLSTFTTAKRGM